MTELGSAAIVFAEVRLYYGDYQFISFLYPCVYGRKDSYRLFNRCFTLSSCNAVIVIPNIRSIINVVVAQFDGR